MKSLNPYKLILDLLHGNIISVLTRPLYHRVSSSVLGKTLQCHLYTYYSVIKLMWSTKQRRIIV